MRGGYAASISLQLNFVKQHRFHVLEGLRRKQKLPQVTIRVGYVKGRIYDISLYVGIGKTISLGQSSLGYPVGFTFLDMLLLWQAVGKGRAVDNLLNGFF